MRPAPGSSARPTREEPLLPADRRDAVVRVIKEKGHSRLPAPVQLASGAWSQDFVDAKRALADGADLRLACQAMVELIEELEVTFDAVGGLTLGADQFAHGIAVLEGKRWFVVRKAPKGRGTNQRVEGAVLAEGEKVVVVDDVVTSGGSMLQALEQVRETGAEVVAAVCLVDRGDEAARKLEELGVAYRPLATYEDLGIPPVKSGGLVSS